MPMEANDSTYKQTFLGEPPYENWNLQDCGIENILSDWELQFQVVNLATIGISLYEDFQEALRNKKYCLKIDPEQGFESNIITEKRLIQILKILTMCSLNQASSDTVVEVWCGENELQIRMEGQFVSDKYIAHMRYIIDTKNKLTQTADRILCLASRIINLSNASLNMEKLQDTKCAWKITFPHTKIS